MSKLIIQNDSDLSDSEALELVLQVMGAGKISNYGKQYCYHTVFPNGVHIGTWLNKKSERFRVWNDS